MRSRSIAIVVMMLATSVGLAQQTRDTVRPVTRGTAVIAGTVVSAEPDRRPIRGARVVLNHITFGVPGETTTTDEAGRFAFTDIPAGQYRLQAGKPGLLPLSYGATRPMYPSRCRTDSRSPACRSRSYEVASSLERSSTKADGGFPAPWSRFFASATTRARVSGP